MKKPTEEGADSTKRIQSEVTKISPLRQLSEMAFAAKKAKYPNLPIHAIPRQKYSDKTANGLTKCVIDFLKLSGWQAERIAVTGRYIDQKKTYTDVIGRTRVMGSGKWIPPSMQPGTADISATIKGRSVKIEVKIGRDKQSPQQAEYQRQVEASGGIYFIARSFDQFFEWYHQTFGMEGRRDE